MDERTQHQQRLLDKAKRGLDIADVPTENLEKVLRTVGPKGWTLQQLLSDMARGVSHGVHWARSRKGQPVVYFKQGDEYKASPFDLLKPVECETCGRIKQRPAFNINTTPVVARRSDGPVPYDPYAEWNAYRDRRLGRQSERV